MSLEQEVFQLSVRTSLNLIYTLSRTMVTVMSMEGEVAADVLRTRSELILREVIAAQRIYPASAANAMAISRLLWYALGIGGDPYDAEQTAGALHPGTRPAGAR